MNSHRHDWDTARRYIQARMAELRLDPVDLARASGLSEKHIRTLINDNGATPSVPRDKTRWALCDALRWTPDSIDRILDGFEPLDVDTSGDLSRLDLLDGRLAEIEAIASTGLDQLRTQQNEMTKFLRLLRRLEDDVRALHVQQDDDLGELRSRLAEAETAIEGLRSTGRPGELGPS